MCHFQLPPNKFPFPLKALNLCQKEWHWLQPLRSEMLLPSSSSSPVSLVLLLQNWLLSELLLRKLMPLRGGSSFHPPFPGSGSCLEMKFRDRRHAGKTAKSSKCRKLKFCQEVNLNFLSHPGGGVFVGFHFRFRTLVSWLNEQSTHTHVPKWANCRRIGKLDSLQIFQAGWAGRGKKNAKIICHNFPLPNSGTNFTNSHVEIVREGQPIWILIKILSFSIPRESATLPGLARGHNLSINTGWWPPGSGSWCQQVWLISPSATVRCWFMRVKYCEVDKLSQSRLDGLFGG